MYLIIWYFKLNDPQVFINKTDQNVYMKKVFKTKLLRINTYYTYIISYISLMVYDSKSSKNVIRIYLNWILNTYYHITIVME